MGFAQVAGKRAAAVWQTEFSAFLSLAAITEDNRHLKHFQETDFKKC